MSRNTNRSHRSTMARWILAAGLLGTGLLGYIEVSSALHSTPHYFDPLILGKGLAPEQYRVLVLNLAYWLTAHVPGLVLYRSISLISTACLLFAGFTLLHLLEASTIFRRAQPAIQWFGTAAFVLLLLFYLQWVGWYYRPDTLPSAATLAAMYWLWALPPARVNTPAKRLLVAAGVLLLSILQGFTRADIAVAMNGGVFLASLLGVRGLSLSRRWAMVCSALGGLVAVGVLAYLILVVYPQATYGDSAKFMLLLNIKHPWQGAPFVLFMLPVAWTAVQGWRRRKELNASSLAVLTAAMLFMVMWLSMGKDDEVRIFAGFAVTLAPVTAELAMRSAEDDTTAISASET